MEPIVAAKRTLKWSLDFINLDLSSLLNKDLFACWAEIREKVYGELGPSIVPDESLVKWEERRKEAKAIQDSMKKYLGAILENSVIQLPQKYFPGIPTTKLKESLNSPLGESILFSIPQVIRVYRTGERVFAFPRNVKDKLLYDFITALSYFPISLIQKCQREGCSGYFLKASEKEKRYCSKKCAWIMASRRHYKSEPELLKAKRREYYRRIKGMVSMGPAGGKERKNLERHKKSEE